MSANEDRSDRPREPGPVPRDNLDALLREWHQRSTEQVAAGRDRLLRALAKRYPRRQSSSGLPLAGCTTGGAEGDRMGSPKGRYLRRWATDRFARVAASILILVGLGVVLLLPDWPSRPGGTALAMDLREVGFAPPLLVLVTGYWPDLNDEIAMQQAEQAVTEARAELERALSAGEDPWQPWSELYRNLRAMGRWEEALTEALAFVEYARQRNEEPERYTPFYWALSDVGNMYLALGDYDTARGYLEQSLRVTRECIVWQYRIGRIYDTRPHALEATLGLGLSPRLWLLSRLAAARGDQQTAWEYHNQAADLLIDFFTKECAHRGVTPIRAPSASEGTELKANSERRIANGEWPMPTQNRDRKGAANEDRQGAYEPGRWNEKGSGGRTPSASEGNTRGDEGDTARQVRPSLYDLCMAVAAAVEEAPESEDRAFESEAIHARQHLLHEAELLRLDRAPDAAAETLAQAKALPYFVHADDYRQDFYFPMEALRIAIAQGNWQEALRAADEADQHAGPRYRKTPDQPPIGVLKRAELRFLRGVALAGLDPADPEALCLIDSAIEAVEQSAVSLPEAQRERLLQRFTDWEGLVDQIRQRSAHGPEHDTEESSK